MYCFALVAYCPYALSATSAPNKRRLSSISVIIQLAASI
jgi:hypothetical protein